MPFSPDFVQNTKVRQWDVWTQIWRACRDIFIITGLGETGSRQWPEGTWVFAQGKIRSATQIVNAIEFVCEDNAGNLFTWKTFAVDGYDDWYNYDGPVEWRGDFYDFLIETCDPRECLHVDIVGQPGASTIQANVTPHHLTERNWTVASLEGKRFKIVRDGFHYQGYFERWPDPPNANIHAVGKPTAATTTTLTDPAKNWAAGTFATGYEVMFLGQDDVLYRRAVTSALGQVLTFASAASPPTLLIQDYWVIKAGRVFKVTFGQPPRPHEMRAWYTGEMLPRITHHASDSTNDTRGPKLIVPKQSISFRSGTAGEPFCTDTTLTVFDEDNWVSMDDLCAGPLKDTRVNPKVTKSPRWVQKFLEDRCRRCLDPTITWHAGLEIYHFTRATMFERAGVGLTWRQTIGTVDGSGIVISLAGIPYTPISLYVSVADANGKVESVTGAPEDDDIIATYDGTRILGSFTSGIEGKTIIAATGWKRRRPRWFNRLHPVTIWLPEIDPGTEELIVPPTDLFPGTYITYPASTHYMDGNDSGLVLEQTGDSNFAFANDKLARFVGDNWHSPLPNSDDGLPAEQPENPWYERWHTSARSPTVQREMNLSLAGVATAAADNRQLTDSTKDWFDVDWWTGGVLVEHTGTGDGASSTTLLQDTAKAGNGFFTQTGRFVDMVVEVNEQADGSGAWHKRLCTVHDGPSYTLTFNYALGFSANGKPFKIREPDSVRGRWKGIEVEVTNDGVTREVVTCEGHDDKTIFVTAPATLTLGVNTSYRIRLHLPGGIYRYSSATGKHTLVISGTDPRAGGIATFLEDSEANLPEFITRYGKMRHGDYLFMQTVQEIKAVIQILKVTESDVTDDPDDVNIKNANWGGSGYGPTDPPNEQWSDLIDDLEAYWGDGVSNPPAGPVSGLPEAHGDGTMSYDDALVGEIHPITGLPIEEPPKQASATRKRTKLFVSQIFQGDCPLARTVKLFMFAQVDGFTDATHPYGHNDGETFCTYAMSGGNVDQVSWSEFHWDAFGTALVYQRWAEVATLSPAEAEETKLSGWIFSTFPGTCPSPPKPSPGACYNAETVDKRRGVNSYKGHVVTQAKALIYWTMPYA